jgi:plasmid maintenance system antidote protein VapI
MKQIQLSKILNLSQGQLSKFLNGKSGCSLQTAKKLTELFGESPLFWLESTSEQRKNIIKGNMQKS